MHTTLLTLALLAGSGTPSAEIGYGSTQEAAAAIAPTLQTGSLIFSSGDCLAVRIFTASPYTHVAAVVVDEQGRCTVYDSTNGVGVRRQPLADYLATQAPVEVHVHHPQRPLGAEAEGEFTSFLESQLGRPYAIQHHLTGDRCTGLHCAEYVTDALVSIDVLQAKAPPRVSPASLREGITAHHIYTTGQTIRLQRPEPVPAGDNACEQMWIDTKSCCSSCCRKLRGWLLCD